MSSYSYAETFSRTHARRLAGRVTTDLRQSHLLYGSPSESKLEEYRAELEELLDAGQITGAGNMPPPRSDNHRINIRITA